tara:strand:+ start:176 stop:484 length:309 start_codon:yes stop_codon:yes gene_type:complete
MKKINLLLISFIFLTSCGSLNEAGKVLRNEKISSTDEFLIEKKDPLIMPPDYNKIPEPDSIGSKKIDDKDRLKKVLKNENVKVNQDQNKTTEIEKSIIDRIR